MVCLFALGKVCTDLEPGMVPTSERLSLVGRRGRRRGGRVLRSTSSSSSSVRNCRIHKRQMGLAAPEVRRVAWSKTKHQTSKNLKDLIENLLLFLEADPGEEAKTGPRSLETDSLHRYHPWSDGRGKEGEKERGTEFSVDASCLPLGGDCNCGVRSLLLRKHSNSEGVGVGEREWGCVLSLPLIRSLHPSACIFACLAF